jgi:lysophospholipase L1-like esterase
MIGTNNTGHRKGAPENTAAGVELIVELLRDRSPEAEVLLLDVFPRGERPDGPLRGINDEVNRRIADLGGREKVTFLEIGDEFLTEDGTLPKEIMPDFLHPKTKGYRIWAEAMEPTLEKMLE